MAVKKRRRTLSARKTSLRAAEVEAIGARREGSRSRVGCANDRPCKSTRYLSYEIALALEPPTVVSSGVVEAACKTLVTQRLKQSGMRWSVSGAQAILTPRSPKKSDGSSPRADSSPEKKKGAAPLRRRQAVGFSRLEGINAGRELLLPSRRAEGAAGTRGPDHERSENQSDRVC